MATYDPVSTATALAENYVYGRQVQLDTASTKVQTQTSALTSLKSSLTTFTSALNTLSGKGDVIAQTATVSKAAEVKATASSKAAAGSYSFYVSKLATAQQSLFSVSDLGLTAATTTDVASGLSSVEQNQYNIPQPSTVALSVGDSGFVSVDLKDADSDGDGKLSVTEIARAVNAAMDGKVTAAVMTGSSGEQQLLLNAVSTGSAGAFKVQSIGGTEITGTRLVAAQDAEFFIGGADGVAVTSATNSYNGIEGLSIEFTAVSTEPVTVTVAKDEAQTQSNMQSFVSAYNTLTKAIDKLTASGSAESGVAAGALSGDSSIRSLRNKLNNLLRSRVDGVSLMDFGISAQRDGTIALDADRFSKKVAANPDALSSLLGQSNTLEYKRSGVLGNLQTYVESWTKTTGGHLQSRQDSLQKQQSQFAQQQSAIDRLYEQAYQRYLLQFSTLASLEDQMSSTSSMLSSMFASNKTS